MASSHVDKSFPHLNCNDDAPDDITIDTTKDITIELLMPTSPGPVKLFKRRWFMIFLFASYSMSNAYQWIHLNIIFDKVVLYYNESLPGGSTYMKEVHLFTCLFFLCCYLLVSDFYYFCFQSAVISEILIT